MRQLEPFSYFVQHASAITGFGGDEKAPDPRYCFHTHYEELSPGRVNYRMRMTGARASKGELTLRVHGYKPGSNVDPSLVGGGKRLLEGLGPDTPEPQVDIDVGFVAIAGVQYALYGYFSEPSDLNVEDILITIDELGTSAPDLLPQGARGQSPFCTDGIALPSRLRADAPPSLQFPVSQDCTPAQLGAGDDEAELLERWRGDIALAALGRYGMLAGGAAGVLMGKVPAGLRDSISARGGRIDEAEAATFHDFVLSFALEEPPPCPQQRFAQLQDTMSRLLHGGLAIFLLRYLAGEDTPTETSRLCRQVEIERWALRLIGLGHDVAQLAFAPEKQRVILPDGTTPFVMIVRRG